MHLEQLTTNMEQNMQSGPVYYRRKRRFWGVFVFAATLIAAFGHILSAEEKDPRERTVLRSRVYKLIHISNAEAKKYLLALNLGTDINELPQNALIVTSDKPSDLTRASSVLRFVDSKEKMEIRTILIASETQKLPQAGEIPDKIDDIFILSFRDAPDSTMSPAAIVDIQDSRLIAIASADVLDRIIESLGKLGPGAAKDEPGAAETPIIPEPKPLAVGAAKAVVTLPKAADTEAKAAAKRLEADIMDVMGLLDEATGPDKVEISVADKVEPEKLPTGQTLAIDSRMPIVPQPAPAAKEPVRELPIQDDFFEDELLDALAEAGARPLEEISRPPAVAIKTAPPAEPVIEPAKEPAKQADQPRTEAPAQVEPAIPPTRKPVAVEEVKPVQPKVPAKRPARPVVRPVSPEPVVKPPAPLVPKPVSKPVQAPEVQAKPPVKVTEPVITKKAPADVPPEPKTPSARQADTEPTPTPEDQAAVSAHQAEISKLLKALADSEAKKPRPEPKPPRAIAEEPAEPVKEEEPAVAKAKPKPPRISHDEHMAQLIADSEKELETVLILPEKVTVQALIELVGKQLGLNYVYDVTTVKGEVMLKIHDGKIKVKDVYALLESVLKFKSLVMVRRGNLVLILPVSQAQNYDPTIITSIEDIRPGDVIVTSVFHLDHITTATAEAMLTRMKLGAQGFNSIAETGTLIVTDYAYRMDRIEQLLDMIDIAGEERKFYSRMLEYMIASKLAGKVEVLARQLGTVQVTIATSKAPTVTRIDPRTKKPIPVPPSRTPAGPVKKGVYVDTDDRTNRIIMIGIKDDVDILNDLIDSLDVPQQGLKSVVEYKINFVEAVEIVNVLNELGLIQISASTGTSTRPTAPRPPTSGGAAQVTEAAQISIRLDSNALLVNATSEQHSAIKMVISYVDVAQEDRRLIREYEIQFVDTAEIIDTLQELGIIEGTSTTRRTSSSTTRPTVPAAKPGTPASTAPRLTGTAEDITSDQPQIAILEATNSLLVKATPAQHDAIATIIAHVDRELDEVITPYVIYALENQDPGELADTLNQLIRETVSEVPRDSKVQAKPQSASLQDEDRIKIISDPASYSLIVFANKKNQQWVKTLIEQLDEYRPQVLLDVTLVEITKIDDFNYDLGIISSYPDLVNPSGLTNTILDSSGNVSFVSDNIISNLLQPPKRDRRRFIDMQSDSGNFTGFYGDKTVNLLLEMMQTKRYGRILAKPKLLVDDNHEGSIETKFTTYITRETSSTQIPDVGAPFTTKDIKFEPYDASIRLDIKPHISKGDNLRLEIVLSRSDFVDLDSTSTKPPDQTITNITTVVTVPNGSTIILGGMDKINQTKGGTKVPILGDIPIIGGLFRSTSNTNRQNKLYVFVKANILRPGTDMTSTDLIDISRENRHEFESMEDEMQEYEDWPGFKPDPMDPIHILEEDVGKF